MTQALYAHMNNKRKMKKKICFWVKSQVPLKTKKEVVPVIHFCLTKIYEVTVGNFFLPKLFQQLHPFSSLIVMG
jgi:hypothetical protein